MLIVKRYREEEQADGTRVIYNLDRPRCPVCGGYLCGYDRRRRVVLDDMGRSVAYLLRRLSAAVSTSKPLTVSSRRSTMPRSS